MPRAGKAVAEPVKAVPENPHDRGVPRRSRRRRLRPSRDDQGGREARDREGDVQGRPSQGTRESDQAHPGQGEPRPRRRPTKAVKPRRPRPRRSRQGGWRRKAVPTKAVPSQAGAREGRARRPRPAKAAAKAAPANAVKAVPRRPAEAGEGPAPKPPKPPRKPSAAMLQVLREAARDAARGAGDLHPPGRVAAAEAEQLAEEMEPGDIQFDEESGEGDTMNVERERDLALSAQALGGRRGDRPRAGQDRRRHLRHVRAVRPAHRAGAARGAAVRRPVRGVQERRAVAPLDPDGAATPGCGGATGSSPLVAAVVVVVDQLTKWWALRTLDDRTIDLVGSLRLTLTFNTGAAFGLGLELRSRRWPSSRSASSSSSSCGGDVSTRFAGGARARAGARRRVRQPRRPALPRPRLPAGRGRRLHRPAVVAGLQRGRRGRSVRVRAAGVDGGPAALASRGARTGGTIPRALDGERLDRVVAMLTGLPARPGRRAGRRG